MIIQLLAIILMLAILGFVVYESRESTKEAKIGIERCKALLDRTIGVIEKDINEENMEEVISEIERRAHRFLDALFHRKKAGGISIGKIIAPRLMLVTNIYRVVQNKHMGGSDNDEDGCQL